MAVNIFTGSMLKGLRGAGCYRITTICYYSVRGLCVPNNLYLIILIVSFYIIITRTIQMYVYLLCMIKVRVRWCTCSLWRML